MRNIFKRAGALCGSVVLLALSAACSAVPASSSQSSEAPQSSVSSEAPEASSLPVNEFPACPTPPERLDLKVAVLKGPSAIGMLPLMELAEGEPVGLSPANNYEFIMAGAPDQIVGGVVSGEYDIAVLPTNLAATLYNKTGGKIQLTTINTLGVLYLLEAGDTIQSVADLKGKTVYSSGKGTTPEYVFNYILEGNGLVPGTDVTVEYKGEHSEITALMAAGQATLAVLPQPFIETALAQNDKLRVALDLTKEWETVSKDGGSLAMSGIVVKRELLEQHPDSITAFLEEYKTSTQNVNDPAMLDEIAALAVKYSIIPKAEIAKKAIPQCNIVFLAGEEMKKAAGGFANALFTANPQSVGGKLPDDGFYYVP